MKILVTGINGFLGSRVAAGIGCNDIVGIGRGPCRNPAFEYYTVDMMDKEAIDALFSRVRFSAVLHFAGVTAHDDIVNNTSRSLDVSWNGTRHLLDAFERNCRNSVFIFSSTGKVYADSPAEALSERHPAEPRTILGKIKRMTELLIEFYAGNHQNQYYILRIFNVYGPGQRSSFVIPVIVEQLRHSQNLILGNMDDARDFIHIDDLCSFYSALLAKRPRPNEGENAVVFNVGSGIPHTVRDIVAILSAQCGCQITTTINTAKIRNNESNREYADIAKAKNILAWEPVISLEEGLLTMIK